MGVRSQEVTDSLMAQFEQAKGVQRLAIANETFRHLSDEGMTDSLIQFGNGTPADTVASQLYLWVSEEMLNKAQYAHCLDYLEKALDLLDEKDYYSISDCWNNVAICQARLGQIPQAIKAAHRAVQADEKTGDKGRLMVSLNTMGGIYIMAKQYDEAKELIVRALDLARQLDDSVKMAVRLGSLSEIESNRGELESALRYALEAQRLDSLRGDLARMAVRQTQVGSVLYTMGRMAEARAVLQQARPVLQQAGNWMSLAICQNLLGHVYLKEQQWDKAAECLQEALATYQLTGERYSQLKAHWGLWKALSHGQLTVAEQHLETYALMKDSLYEEETARLAAEYEAKYRNEELVRQNEEQQQRSFRLKVVAAVALAVLVIIVVLFIYILRMRARTTSLRMQLLSEEIGRYEALAAAQAGAGGTGQNGSEGGPVAAENLPFVKRLTAAVREGLAQRDFNATVLAQNMAMSYSQLNRRMQDMVGTSPAVFIMQFRLEKAKRLLASTDSPIGDIATQCGFEDHSYFTRAFKQAFGETPKEYRQQHYS